MEALLVICIHFQVKLGWYQRAASYIIADGTYPATGISPAMQL